MEHFAKIIMPECWYATRNFSGQEEGPVELGHFDKCFVKNTMRPFLSKIRKVFFLSGCMPVSVAENVSISLTLPKYPWKWLNKLFWLCQSSKYTFSSYMFGRCLKMPPVLNKSGFWIWHGCICKGYAEFLICLIMTSYASIMPEYASLCLNVPQCWNRAE